MSQPIQDLYAAIRSVIDEATMGAYREQFAGTRERLADAPRFETIVPTSLTICDQWLGASLADENPRWRAMSIAAQAALPQLRWQVSYKNLPPSPGLASFQDDYAWAPLVMPSDEAPVRTDGMLVGFTVQAPHITYPGHHHKPFEIYGIVSGSIEWRVGNDDWELKRPGDVIVHRSHELHAMRTLDEPCVTWVAWDRFDYDSVYMPELDPPGTSLDAISYEQ